MSDAAEHQSPVNISATTNGIRAVNPSITITVTIPVNCMAASTASAQDSVNANLAQTASLPNSPAPSTTSADLAVEAVAIDPNYSNREGYDPEFLGRGNLRVPLPKLTNLQRRSAARLLRPEAGDDPFELKYHHYSVVMHAQRRLAFFTAVNIDGQKAREIEREKDRWSFDPRIRRDQQLGNELYADNPFDRGHLVRRLDPAWGRTFGIAKSANDDTFHFTNCSPQHERFNQGQNLWQGIENFLLDRATESDQRMTVFTGPVFRDDDPEYRDVPIPREYWKVAVLVGSQGRLRSLGFIVTQADLIEPIVESTVESIETARLFQTSVAEIATLTGLDFGSLVTADAGGVDQFETPATEAAAVTSAAATRRIPLQFLDQIRGVTSSAVNSSPPESSTLESSTLESTALEAPAAVAASSATDSSTGRHAVTGTDLNYYLVAYDENSQERPSGAAGLVSDRVIAELTSSPVTDVFIFSHGWMGDVPAAHEQYQGWIQAMASCAEDRQRIRQKRPGFRPLLIGVHWPSLPWGDEEFESAPALESVSSAASSSEMDSALAQRVATYSQAIGDSEHVRRMIRSLLEASRQYGEADIPVLPPPVRAIYRELDAIAALPKSGVAGSPGADIESFDADAIYAEARAERAEAAQVNAGLEALSFPWLSRDTVLAPLRTLSFWKMKDRARVVGETGVHPLLRRMQAAIGARDVRIHLAGHSFGCIVASAAIAGPKGGPRLARPVDSLSLLQGALSLWTYCASIPAEPSKVGYFHRIIALGLVKGAIMTTQSIHDTAVGKWYPRGAKVAGDLEALAVELPKYGAVGAFGIQGLFSKKHELKMLPENGAYDFQPGHVYNVESSNFINQGSGFSGAHSDIRKKPVAHAVWSAIG